MLTKFSQAQTSSASKGESASCEKFSQELDELNHKINSQMDSLSKILSRSEAITSSLEGSIAGAVKLKDDLSDWIKSVHGGDFSLKIDEIHKEVKKGLNSISDSEPRMSYRRALLSQNSSRTSQSPPVTESVAVKPITMNRAQPSRHRYGKGTSATKHTKKRQLKAVLITDSIMRGFDEELFSRKYHVMVINQSHWNALASGMQNMADAISNSNPDIVYIHLGVNDIRNGRSLDEITKDVTHAIDKILRVTKQSCTVIVSNILFCAGHQNSVKSINTNIASTIQKRKRDHESSEYWNRVGVNANSNFTSDGRINPKMFSDDELVHISKRGISVIIGNFRTSLNDALTS